MQNTIQKFRQSSIVFEKPGILSENLKTLTSSSYLTVQHLLLKLRTHFLLSSAYRRMCRIFSYFIQTLSYFQKLKKTWFLHTRFLQFYVFYSFFINNSRSKQNKQNPTHLFVDITKQKTSKVSKISTKNIKIYNSRGGSSPSD